jgi:hypothetical protein
LFLSVKDLFFGLEPVIEFGARLIAASRHRVGKRDGECVLRDERRESRFPLRVRVKA